jgi:hypothetical protein
LNWPAAAAVCTMLPWLLADELAGTRTATDMAASAASAAM